MTENETKIVQSCLDIINNTPDICVEDFANTQIYTVYCGKKHVFSIAKDFTMRVNRIEYTLDIDQHKFVIKEHQPDLDNLYTLCKKKYEEQKQLHEKNAFNFLAQFKVSQQKGKVK